MQDKKDVVEVPEASFLLITAGLAIMILTGRLSACDATSYVIDFYDESGELWGQETFSSEDDANAALAKIRDGYRELGWGPVNAKVRSEVDYVGGVPTKSRSVTTGSFSTRLAILREDQLQGQWKRIDGDASSVVALSNQIAEAKRDVNKLKSQGEDATAQAYEKLVVQKKEADFKRDRSRLSNQLSAFESRVRDFNSKRKTLGYGTPYEPPVVSLRKRAGLSSVSDTSVTGLSANRSKNIPRKPSSALTIEKLIGDWLPEDRNRKMWITFDETGVASYHGYAGVSGRVKITGNVVTFSTDEGFTGQHGVDFHGIWKNGKIQATLTYHKSLYGQEKATLVQRKIE